MEDMYINESPEEWEKRVLKRLEKTKKKKQESSDQPRKTMRNITINFPYIYDKNLEKLKRLGQIPSRSEGVRIAIREFLQKEYKIMKMLGCFDD